MARLVLAIATACGLAFLSARVVAANSTVEVPHWDLPSGIYSNGVVLHALPAPEGTRVHVTLDGSLPTATHGDPLDAPVPLQRSTVVRAVAVKEGQLSRVLTASYLVPEAVALQEAPFLPQTWGIRDGQVLPAAYRMRVLPGVPGADRNDVAAALRSLPSLSLVLPPDDLWSAARGLYVHTEESGEGWERTASLQWIPTNGPAWSPIDCGLRIQGGWSRRPEESPKHSFRLLFRKRYGSAPFRGPVFGEPAESFGTLILRGGNNNSWLHPSAEERSRAEYLRDSWMRVTHAAMGHPAARGRFVHLYLNGLYWGIYQVTERPDPALAARAFGGEAADYDARNADKVIAGDDAAWKQLFALANAGMHSAAEYERLGALLDVPAFIDFILLNLYGANADWDGGSNWYAVRRRVPAGGYQFLEWDGERTLESPKDNRIATDDDQSPMRLFQRLREWPTFRMAMQQRAKSLLAPEGPLGPGPAAQRYARLAAELEPAIAAESARWGWYRKSLAPFRTGPYEHYTRESHWRPEVDRLIHRYFPERAVEVRQQWIEAGVMKGE